MTRNQQPICLEETLAELSPELASEDFTRRVLDELGHRTPAKRFGLSPRWVAMLASFAAIGLGFGFWLRWDPAAEPTDQDESAKLLRLEFESLQSEVDALRSLASQPPPVLYLGGDSRIDLVLDLGQSGLDPTKLDIRPAAAGTRQSDPGARRIQ